VVDAATVFVAATWLGLFLLGLTLIGRYGGRTPFFDDFSLFQLQTYDGVPPLSLFWEPLNEHRYPLPKFAAWATARAAGFNLRAQMRENLAILALAAGVLVLAARRVRGSTRPVDAFFPLVLLSFGQAENLVWSVEICYVLPVALACVCLALLAPAGGGPTVWRLIGLAAAAAGSTLCGMQGVLIGAPVGVWLVWLGLRKRSALSVVAGAVVLALVAIILVSFESASHHPAVPPDWLAVRYTFRVLGGGWGPVAEMVGPTEPTPFPTLFGVATAVLVLGAVRFVARAAVHPAGRPGAVGYLAFLSGVLAICGAVGVSRWAINHGVLANRYVTLATPLLCWAYLAYLRFGSEAARCRVCPGMFLVAAVAAWPNADWGVGMAREWARRQFLIEQDVKRGVPVPFLVEHHGGYLYPPAPEVSGPVFETLRLKKIPPFQNIPSEPKLREVPTAWRVNAAVPGADPDGWRRVGLRDQVRMIVECDLPPAARGLVIRSSLTGTPNLSRSKIGWREDDGGTEPVLRVVPDAIEIGDGKTKRIWLGRPVHRIEVAVDGPADVRVDAVTALVDE
jgi:hypothetical protein